jgi:hypothetical protein
MSWDTDTSSTSYCTSTAFTNFYGAKTEPESKPKSKAVLNSEAMGQIVKAGVLKGATVIFGHRRSPVFKDRDGLRKRGINAFYTDAIESGCDIPPNINTYSFAVIIDALEYIPNMMARANLIKEALVTLSLSYSKSHVIMMVKTPGMVSKFAEKHKYEKTDSGFLIPKDRSLGGLYMNGITAEELIVTANFAGAGLAEIYSDVETDMTCVRAWPKREKQNKKQKDR